MKLAIDQTKSPCKCCRNSFYHSRGCCALTSAENLPAWVDAGDWDGKHWYMCEHFANKKQYAEKYDNEAEVIYQSGVERGQAIRRNQCQGN